MQNIGIIDLTTSQVLKPKVGSEVIQPNEGGHDMLEMMLGKRKKSVDENILKTLVLNLVQMLVWLELGGERQAMVIPI